MSDVVVVTGVSEKQRSEFIVELAEHTGRALISASKYESGEHDLSRTEELIVRAGRTQPVLVELDSLTPLSHAIGALSHSAYELQLREVVCVVDALQMLNEFPEHGGCPAPLFGQDWVTAVRQLEFASLIAIVNHQGIPPHRLTLLLTALNHFAPTAALRLHESGRLNANPWASDRYDLDVVRPGWANVMNDEFSPSFSDRRFSAFRYEQIRPFHPARLARLVDRSLSSGRFGTLLRSAGFCRLATRPDRSGQWDHVGDRVRVNPLPADPECAEGEELLAIGQDVVFMGLDLKPSLISAAFDHVCLTDEEFILGPETWQSFADPLPSWLPSVNDQQHGGHGNEH